MLHAGVAVVAVHLIATARGLRRAIGLAVLAGLALKVAGETPWAAEALRHPAGWDIAVAPFAHAERPGRRRARVGAGREAVAPPARPYHRTAMTERKAHLDAFAVVTIVFCCFLWGLNQVAAKAAMPEIPALWQAAARSARRQRSWSGSGRASRGTRLFDRDGTLPGGLLAGVLFARRVLLHLHRPAVHDRVADGRLRSTSRPSSSPSACR